MTTRYLFIVLLVITNYEVISQQIFCGENHSLLVCENGDLYTFGDNGSGQLGTGDYMYQTVPFLVDDLPPVVNAAGGGFHSAAVTEDGEVYTWGSGSDGQIGDGTQGNFYTTPQLINGISNVVHVSAGRYFTAALKSDGTVWTWGRNDSGNLGLGNYDMALVPTQVPGLINISKIECGNWSLFAIDESGNAYAMGDNNFAMLGLGSNFPPTYNTPQLMGLDNVHKIEAGYGCAIAIKNDNSVWVWGDDTFGQLGQGQPAFANSPIPFTAVENVQDISAGNSFAQVLDANGNVHLWGSNQYGQLCNGTDNNFSNTSASPASLSNIVEFASGDFHTLYINADGELLGCGKNDGGQLGNGSTTNTTFAVVGTNSCAEPQNIESTSLHHVTVYPNPTANNLNISLNVPIVKSDIEVFDLTGRRVPVEILLNEGLHISLSTDNLPLGQYIILLSNENGTYNTRFTKAD